MSVSLEQFDDPGISGPLAASRPGTRERGTCEGRFPCADDAREKKRVADRRPLVDARGGEGWCGRRVVSIRIEGFISMMIKWGGFKTVALVFVSARSRGRVRHEIREAKLSSASLILGTFSQECEAVEKRTSLGHH